MNVTPQSSPAEPGPQPSSSRRAAWAAKIAARLQANEAELRRAFQAAQPVRHFVVDDLLGEADAAAIARGYPDPRTLLRRSTLRERKRVGIHTDRYDPIIGDALFCFQDPAVVAAIGRITGYTDASADPSLYASGVSVMARGDFLNPHIDNSHDGDGKRYRVLNLLYYVSPNWTRESGGNLEVWDPAVRTPTVIDSRFDRLVVMETGTQSWHSVAEVRVDATRRCVSNYYFSHQPPGGTPYRHVTTFTGRPEQPLRRAVLAVVDGVVLNTVARVLPFTARLTRHRRKTAD